MRRIVLATLALALLSAAPAEASDHLMLVNEVYPSANASEQFVELRDPASEPFPSPPYRLRLYEADGTPFSPERSQEFAQPYPFASTSQPVVFGPPGGAPLNVALPTDTSQVCFEQGPLASPRRIHCIGYGSVTNPIQLGMPITQTPAAGQSVQLQFCGKVAPSAPTPGAANTQTGACSGGGGSTPGGGGPGGGTGGGGPGGGDTQDLTPPQQKVGAKKRQDVDRLAVTVTLSEAGRVTARGSVNVRGAARLFRFKPVTRSAAANTPVKLRLRLGRAARRSVKAALRDGRRIKARISIAARDGAGNPSSAKRTIQLTD
jgi:hypothetical protein